jgi:hypothetical protein
MTDKSNSLTEALDRLRETLAALLPAGMPRHGHDEAAFGTIDDALKAFSYPNIASGKKEHVLAFNNDEHISLRGLPDDINNIRQAQLKQIHDKPSTWPFFSSHGPLTDLHGRVLRGSRVETSFPVDPLLFGDTGNFPPVPPFPYDQPPVEPGDPDYQNPNLPGKDIGFSKQAYFLTDDDWFVTVGPSLPKIALLANGGAQFWVGSIGLISYGYGHFANARGVTTYVGSGYFAEWPDSIPDQLKKLRDGFRALVGTYVKVVFEDELEG